MDTRGNEMLGPHERECVAVFLGRGESGEGEGRSIAGCGRRKVGSVKQLLWE